MQLRYISIPALIAAAGGDPWAINHSLQVGRPAQISDLAEAFYAAGRCATEAIAAFNEARRRFEAAWNRQNGEHPINDSGEVQRVVQSLGAQSEQLPKIAVDLENIAAALAEAQRSASGQIATLEGQLQKLDDLIGQAVEMEKNANLSADDRAALSALIDACEHDAIEDTKAALAAVQSTRNGYGDSLHKSLGNLRAEGYDPTALRGMDSDEAPPASGLQNAQLGDIREATNQAVLDQWAKVQAAKDALNKALATLYTKGPGSTEGEAASQSLPKLKADLARALDDLGMIPDYNGIDPASVSTTPDGRFLFTYNVNGQPIQVSGQLKDGTGEFFDQATLTYYTFQDGKLTGMRALDPGRVEATPEPLWTAVSLVAGGPALKAGSVAAWQGLKALLTREGLEGLTGENLFARSLSAAQIRAGIAEADPLRSPPPGAGGLPVAAGTHPVPPPLVEHTPPAAPGGSALGDHPPPVVVDSTLPVAGSVRTVNPGGGNMNCVNCVIATDQMLDGAKVSATLDGPKPIGFLESYFGSYFAPVVDRAAIEATMTAAGDGARGVVFASPGPGQVGHVFNVVNQNGVIRFLDGQLGGVAPFDGYQSLYFMRYR